MAFSRRAFLGTSGLVLAGCAARRVPIASRPAVPALARVNVSPARVIRTIVGLRPFRPSGFVVRGEKLGDKTLIHNYGHGGAGITLSWGTAQLAVDEAARSEARDCAVIGCGVVGLSTARVLQQRGYSPVIYAREMPPSVTSNVAGGLWDPVTVYDSDKVAPEFRRQFGEASRLAFRRYQSMTGDLYGVRWMPLYSLSRDGPRREAGPDSPYAAVQVLYPEAKQLAREDHPFDVPFVYQRYSMLIEPAIYLNALIRDYQLSGGRIVIREFQAREELMTLRENLLFNCTGLGAGKLFGDGEVTPIRGQLSFLLPQPEVGYMTVGPGDIYMFPRHDGILLGGSHERGDWNTEPDPATTERIVRENAALFRGMRG
ncbi:MAG TPA: FAD-dependent oxidoreductase [Bryobacteraceae bacterium]|nr:FAD-dependent oxidoreductase [Bryobacteraceae bacterium]